MNFDPRFSRLELDEGPRVAAPVPAPLVLTPTFPTPESWEFSGSPRATDGDGHKVGSLQRAYRRIRDEHRRDLVIHPSDITMSDGALCINGTTYPVEHNALSRVFGDVVNGLGGMGNVAHKAIEKRRFDGLDALFNAGVLGRNDGKSIRIGTRKLPGQDGMTVYRAVSSTYGVSIGSLQILEAIGHAIALSNEFEFAHVSSDGYWMRIELREAPKPSHERRIGDICRRVTVWTADDASSAAHFRAGAYRLACLNGMTVPHSILKIKAIRHQRRRRGYSLHSVMLRRIREAFALSDSFVSDFERVAMEAEQDSKLAIFADVEAGKKTPKEAIAGLVRAKHFAVAGLSTDKLVTAVTAAWDKEPGYTRLSLVNAFTRAAHENQYGAELQASLEELGTGLVYTRLAFAPAA